MTGLTCPIDGCDYGTAEGDNKTLGDLRSHTNAKGDDEHDWPAVRAAVTAQETDADETETETDDQPEAEEEQDEPDETSETDEPEMDQSDEYADQIEQGEASETSEESDGSGDTDETDDQPDDQASSSGGPSGLAILAGTVVLGMAVLLATSSNDDEEPIEVESTAADADETADEPEATWE